MSTDNKRIETVVQNKYINLFGYALCRTMAALRGFA